MNWNGLERKRSWHNLRHYPDLCLEGLRDNTKNLRARFEVSTFRIQEQNLTAVSTFSVVHQLVYLHIALYSYQPISVQWKAFSFLPSDRIYICEFIVLSTDEQRSGFLSDIPASKVYNTILIFQNAP